MKNIIQKIKRNQFLFSELVKRDFKQKYKGTTLGMLWSVLSPLLQLMVMRLVFTEFFGRNTPYYTTYLFSGLIVFNFYTESTRGSMGALLSNKDILSKIKIPKLMFLLSRNVSSIINFMMIFLVYLVFVAIDGVRFSFRFLALAYPIVMLILFCAGVGMILSALQIFFRDTKYLYDIFVILLRYMSAVFYRIDSYPERVQRIFLCNPVYAFIKYFRVVVMEGHLPSPAYHLLLLLYAGVALLVGLLIYKKYNQKFVYYF